MSPMLILAAAAFDPLGGCALVRPVTFFERLDALPPEIRADFERRVGKIYGRNEKGVNFSDFPPAGAKTGKMLQYVGHAKGQWLISYMYGGIAIRQVTVSYLLTDPPSQWRGPRPVSKPYLLGALEGRGCDTANALLRGISVEPGWNR